MSIWMIWAYLAFCASGVAAVVNFFRSPHVDSEGFDVSWCEFVAFMILSLIPAFSVSMNFFWLWALRQKIKRRPLINWPHIQFPEFRWPKCPIAFRAKKSKEDENDIQRDTR